MTTEEQAVCQEQQIADEQMRLIYSVECLIVFQREGHTKLTCKEVCIFMYYKFSFTKGSISEIYWSILESQVKQPSATLLQL